MRSVLALTLLLSACSPSSDYGDMKQRMTELEQQKKAAPREPTPAPKKAAPSGPATPEQEEQAKALMKEANAAVLAGELTTGLDKVNAVLRDLPGSKAAQQAKQLRAEIKVVGTEPEDPIIEHWYRGGEGDEDFDKGTTFVVFWETWCPHCRREVPKLEEFAKAHAGKIKVLGLTRQSRDVTDDAVRQFLDESVVSYPIAREDGRAAAALAIAGIPAAAIVKDGKVVWRGHPARVDDAVLQRVL
jgi:thiol-disulfide isomerase/thioredoxin